jgi:hypothetical protein
MKRDPSQREFTIEEANRAVKNLKRAMPEIRGLARTIRRTEDRLVILDLICDRTVGARNPDLRDYLGARERYHGRIADLDERLDALAAKGYLLDQVQRGIVHFPARHGDRPVLLCWREGETRVGHWHELDGGDPDEDRRLDLTSWEES